MEVLFKLTATKDVNNFGQRSYTCFTAIDIIQWKMIMLDNWICNMFYKMNWVNRNCEL